MEKKVALITGVTGQDGSYLAELLLEKGYLVHGITRRSSTQNNKRIAHIKNLVLHYSDLSDSSSLGKIISRVQPDEVYNLGAMTHVHVSFDIPEYTGDVDGIAVVRLLEAIRLQEKKIKFYQAGTSEMYGGIYTKKQNENTPFYPRSPYAVAKVYGFWMTKNYREAYNMFTVNGILFNHTSPRRGHNFVEQKIIQAAIAIKNGTQEYLSLGNIYTTRDFGHSKDYVKAMWMMLQQERPDDYVISSGKTILIKDIVNIVFNYLKMPLIWEGKGVDETASFNDKIIVRIDSKNFRPSEVDNLVGDYSKSKKKLNWEPTYTFKNIMLEMIEHESLKYDVKKPSTHL